MGVASDVVAALPNGVSAFVGRERELRELDGLLERERLVTLTGPPGIGKTRLALEAAGRAAGGERFPGGAALVELAAVSDPELVPRAVAAALSVPEMAGLDVTDALVAHLRARPTLLVLDNCEHLIEGCARLVDALLRACGPLTVLATSRESLAVAGELVWRVPQLAVPAAGETDPATLAAVESVALFLQRARTLRPELALDDETAPAVARLSRRLEGIPLAIELAAARMDVLTAAEIAARLDDRFALLTRGSRSDLPRHRTLRAALDWSHDLLDPAERAVLRRLGVFAGGFCLEGAEAVCAGEGVEAEDVLDTLGRLVAKSLVVSNTANSRGRYRLLETIRAYAIDRLDESGEAPDAHEAHARFCLELAERAEPELTGPRQHHWFERLEGERENLRLALYWSAGHGRTEWALRLGGALVLFWRVRCHFTEGRDLLRAALDAAGEEDAGACGAKALWGLGFMTLMAGDRAAAVPLLERSVERFAEAGDAMGRCRGLLILANSRPNADHERTLALLELSVEAAREAGDAWCLAHALALAGMEYEVRNRLSSARPLLEEALAVAREAGDRQGLRFALGGLVTVANAQGDYRHADALSGESVRICSELGDAYSEGMARLGAANLALARGDYARARRALDDACAVLPPVTPINAAILLPLTRGWLAHAERDRDAARAHYEDVQAVAAPVRSVPALIAQADLAADGDDPDSARELYEAAHQGARQCDQPGHMARALHGLGLLARDRGEDRHAAALHHEALALQLGVGLAPDAVRSLEAIAGLCAAAERHTQAARLLGAAGALREHAGYARAPWDAPRWEADMALVRERLPADRLAAALAEGAELSLEEAVAQASKGRGPRGRPARGWESLTEVELQVAHLVADELTNREIAARLLMSVGAVKGHLYRIFPKLGVTGRTGLARAVWSRQRSAATPNGHHPGPAEPEKE